MTSQTQNSIPEIFNRKTIKHNHFKFNKLYKQIANELAERIKETNINFEYALELNSKTLSTGTQIENTKLVKNLYRTIIHSRTKNTLINFYSDEEFLPIKNNSLDLVYSVLGVNTVNDIPGTFRQIYNALKSN